MEKEICIKEWIENYESGKYNSKDRHVQCEAGWYDWFCEDKSLFGRLKKLAPKVKQLAKSPYVDANNWYVWFKNNCPCWGPLYDDFRFAEIETGEVVFTIAFRSNDTSNVEVWGKQNNFAKPLISGTWEDVKKYFGV